MLESGCHYRLTTKSGKSRDVVVVNNDPIERRVIVKASHGNAKGMQTIRLSDYTNCRKIRACAARNTIKKVATRNPNTHLYMFQLDKGIYKIGCTDDVEGRLRNARTWCANLEKKATRKIPTHKSANWRSYEHQVHNHFSAKRCANGGTEVFRFSAKEAADAIDYLKTMRFQ